MSHDQQRYIPAGEFDPLADVAEGQERQQSPAAWLTDRLARTFDGLDPDVPQVKTMYVEGRPQDAITMIRRPGDGGYVIETVTDIFAKLAPRPNEVVTGKKSTTEVVDGVVRAKTLNGKPYPTDPELRPGQSDEAWAARLGDRLARSKDEPTKGRAVGKAIARIFFPNI